VVKGKAMQVHFSRFQFRALLAFVALVIGLAASWWAARWFMVREWRRNQLLYHTSSEREHRDFERRLREQIGYVHQAGADDRDVTDRIFELLQSSAIAANSREVEFWRSRSPSPERTAVALRWAEAAVDEARFYAALHGTWRRDYERGGMGHHITGDEVPPFKMPASWTVADLLYTRQGVTSEP
jgi:hypothetical protein